MKASEVRSGGDVVGRFTVEEPAEKGRAKIQKGGAVAAAARDMADAVEQVTLPVEQREQVLRFQTLLREGTVENSRAARKVEGE